jgi:NodT family efflux transporter outer membrane factor (OMF) lipoprotein
MSKQSNIWKLGAWSAKFSVSLVCAAVLGACANYSGIHSTQHIDSAHAFQTTQSLPAEGGHWPNPNWADQFGDAQLKALIVEALKNSPTLDQARARVAAAAAFSEGARANTLPKVDANVSSTRERYSASAPVPPPYGGSWQTQNQAVLSASYDLDLWGKNREALKASLSEVQQSEAESEVVKLTLSESITRTYNQLARLYALRDIAQREVQQREQFDRITAGRIATGLDTEVERRTSKAKLAASQTNLSALDGSIVTTRYQLAALLGAGPDRGLQITRPTLGIGEPVLLPNDLPADLVSRRPDIVAARWHVDALTHDVKSAKAEFYPDVNLSATTGLEAFGFGRLLTMGSSTDSAGAAIHLPIFDGGALRANLKGQYADFDSAVATYNQTLISALSEVATQVAQIRSTDEQLVTAQVAEDESRSAYDLAIIQYKAGLTNQLTVLSADINALTSEQEVTNLRMGRRDQQIALAAALGGGFSDTSSSTAASSPDHDPQDRHGFAGIARASAVRTPAVPATE